MHASKFDGFRNEEGCRVAWVVVVRGGRLPTVFTGDLLQVRPGDAQNQTAAYIVRGTYISSTAVIGAFSTS
jgi:hypothetical protein